MSEHRHRQAHEQPPALRLGRPRGIPRRHFDADVGYALLRLPALREGKRVALGIGVDERDLALGRTGEREDDLLFRRPESVHLHGAVLAVLRLERGLRRRAAAKALARLDFRQLERDGVSEPQLAVVGPLVVKRLLALDVAPRARIAVRHQLLGRRKKLRRLRAHRIVLQQVRRDVHAVRKEPDPSRLRAPGAVHQEKVLLHRLRRRAIGMCAEIVEKRIERERRVPHLARIIENRQAVLNRTGLHVRTLLRRKPHFRDRRHQAEFGALLDRIADH